MVGNDHKRFFGSLGVKEDLKFDDDEN